MTSEPIPKTILRCPVVLCLVSTPKPLSTLHILRWRLNLPGQISDRYPRAMLSTTRIPVLSGNSADLA